MVKLTFMRQIANAFAGYTSNNNKSVPIFSLLVNKDRCLLAGSRLRKSNALSKVMNFTPRKGRYLTVNSRSGSSKVNLI